MLKTKRLTIAEIREEIRTIDRFRIVIKGEKSQFNGQQFLTFYTKDRKVSYLCQMTKDGWLMTHKQVSIKGCITIYKAK